MSFIAVLLTFLLIVNCGVLVLLILVQLPKKDAGAGLAFGGGTADALFGAGSGNALTKITKWATGAFVVLTIILGSMQVRMHNGSQSLFQQGVEQQQQMQTQPQVRPQELPPGASPSTPTTPVTTPAAVPSVPATPTPTPAPSSNGK
ncbi:MAG TPA: preprotein translocase subunit SecG [Verrucomicrobiae bacterium]|nr:preprotein translocase subunit SecG [Verrucomicrobiae bacterium]